MEAALWGLIGTVVGAAASILTKFIAARNSTRLQESAASHERLAKHRAFQRDTLLELQEAFHDEIRSAAQVHHADSMAIQDGEEWGSNLLDEELNERARLTGRRTLLLLERIEDDNLRRHLKSVRSRISQVMVARDKASANAAFDTLMPESAAAMEHIGTVLRSLYLSDLPEGRRTPGAT